MDWESAFKVASGVIGAMGAWFLRSAYAKIEAQSVESVRLNQRQNDFELYVAKAHTTKDELKDAMILIRTQLNRIEEKLDGNLGKP